MAHWMDKIMGYETQSKRLHVILFAKTYDNNFGHLYTGCAGTFYTLDAASGYIKQLFITMRKDAYDMEVLDMPKEIEVGVIYDICRTKEMTAGAIIVEDITE